MWTGSDTAKPDPAGVGADEGELLGDGAWDGDGDGLGDADGVDNGVLLAVSVVDCVQATQANAKTAEHVRTRNQPLISLRKCKGCQIGRRKIC